MLFFVEIETGVNKPLDDAFDATVLAFCNGNVDALGTLYTEWSQEFFFIAYKYVRNKEDAYDLVSDTFEKLLKMPITKRNEKFITQGVNLKALLIVAIKNKALDKLKVDSNRKRILGTICHSLPKNAKNDVIHYFSKELTELILSVLPHQEYTIFKMSLEGYSREEIAHQLSLSPKTISNSLSISRNKIKELLEFI